MKTSIILTIAHSFTSHPGLSSEAQNCETPLDYFHLFFTEEIKELILTETRYAEQNMPPEQYLRIHPDARANEWRRKPMKLEEVVLATVMIIGIMGFPKLR